MEHRVVSHEQWVEARRQHLAAEKKFTRDRDALSQARRDLPWERVDKQYALEGPDGPRSLAELFDGRGQLVIYHAMFNPATATDRTSWTKDAACTACSYWMDNFDRIVVHLNHRDITMAAVSQAPVAAIEAYRKRMGWTFNWYSSAGSDFNFDYHVSFKPDATEAQYNYEVGPFGQTEAPGVSVFLKQRDEIFHTYSTYARGLDMLNVAYHYMDLVPKGRDEGAGNGMSWLRRRDEYPA